MSKEVNNIKIRQTSLPIIEVARGICLLKKTNPKDYDKVKNVLATVGLDLGKEESHSNTRKTKDISDILLDYVSRVEARKLKVPKDEKENQQWILRERLATKPETLRAYRYRGQRRTLKYDKGILGIDILRQIYWQSVENSKMIFYLKRTVYRTSAK